MFKKLRGVPVGKSPLKRLNIYFKQIYIDFYTYDLYDSLVERYLDISIVIVCHNHINVL